MIKEEEDDSMSEVYSSDSEVTKFGFDKKGVFVSTTQRGKSQILPGQKHHAPNIIEINTEDLIKTTTKKPQQFDNEYDRVCASLQLNAVPDFLPCRDKERN